MGGKEGEREKRERESSPSCRSYLHTNLCPSLYSCCEFNLLFGLIRSSGFTRDVLTEQHSRKLKRKTKFSDFNFITFALPHLFICL